MERFRTVKISDPRFEQSGLRYMTLKSKYLKGRGNICIYVPKTDRTDLPVVTLLHGVYGSSNSWARGAGAHLTAQRMIESGEIKPVILAMPSDGLWGDGSAYLPHNNYNFEKWISSDVIDAIRLHIPQAKDSSVNFLAGLSMGGYGALRLGAKYADTYKAFSGLSAITSLEQMALFVEEELSNYKQNDRSEEDVFQLIKSNRENIGVFRFDCGSDDILIEHNRKLHNELTDARIQHIYKENDGAHEWCYWERHLSDTLLFFNEQL